MSAASGIGISKDLSDTFASAVEGNTVRFVKVGIENGISGQPLRLRSAEAI